MPITNPEVTSSRARLWICLALVAATLAVYWPVMRFAFINFDDPDYVTQNAYVLSGLTWPGVAWALQTGHSANWHPLTWLSHMFDAQLFGLQPGPHHLVNLLFHIANTLLLFLLFQGMTKALWRSAFVAALFAVHPLHVESVAWVAERKDVLSTFFGLLAIWAYASYAKAEGSVHIAEWKAKPRVSRFTFHVSRFYLLSLALFALSLMSKPMLVTLPFLLLLLDWWPLGRVGGRRNKECRTQIAETGITPDASLHHPNTPTFRFVLEKLPFLALSALSSVITVLAQKAGHALLTVDALPLWQRVANSLVSYVRYIGKAVWPNRLTLPYPYPGAWPTGTVLLAAFVLAVISLLALRWARRRAYVAVGWFWFLGALVPVIGLVQVGPQALADRYTYVPLIGLFVLAAWLATDRLSRWRYGPAALAVGGSSVVLVCLGLASNQTGYWKDSETLFRHSLAVSTNNYVAHDNLGDAFADQGKREDARADFAAAIRIKPGFAHAYSNMGKLAYGEGNFAAAADWFRQALGRHPDDPEIHSNLAAALASQHQPEEAIAHYLEAIRLEPGRSQAQSDVARLLLARGKLQSAVERGLAALRLKPDSTETLLVVGNALFLQGKLEPAAVHYRTALKATPNSAAVRLSLGRALAGLREFGEAEAQVSESLLLQPDSPDAHEALATIYKAQNRFREARAQYEAALRLVPDWPEVLNNLAWLMATQSSAELRDGARAATLAERACQMTGSTNLWLLSTLAAAYAEAGRFPEAVHTQQKVLDLAAAQGQAGDRFQRRLELYRSQKPYHEP